MREDVQVRRQKRRRLWLVLAVLFVLLVALVAPPLISVSRYKGQITHLIADSLGRPVRLASVRVRLLPWPGFVLSDLSVEEDPAYGAEPVLHASSVIASIRLLSLWRGRLEISSISVEDASLNLVRSAPGRWNLDPVFRTAAAKAGRSSADRRRSVPLPSLEATNLRINIKNGAEKLPFSLVDSDLSFWQQSSGEWRIRLRGQPARTDVNLDLADTGIVRLEASVGRAPELRLMPLHVDLEWRQAQLGQLTKLVLGSDAGWRGDLTAELHLDGTPDAAKIQTRLRATGVHRAEFLPAEPMDFDANCGFIYHYARRALENLACDSPLGDGRIHIAGDIPGAGGSPHLSADLKQIPVAAALDLLRTLRSGIEPDLEAKGTITGKLTYTGEGAQLERGKSALTSSAKAAATALDPLEGSLTVEDFVLSGSGLSQPIQAPRFVLTPVAASHPVALAGTVAIPAGGAVPLTVSFQLGLKGYQATARGQASFARGRELAQAAGLAQASALESLAGEPASVDLSAAGQWLPPQQMEVVATPESEAAAEPRDEPQDLKPETASPADRLTGTVTVHNANWKADYLAGHVLISEATLHFDDGLTRWDPVVFSYGPVKGTASVDLPIGCDPAEPCPAHFQVQFSELDASALQAALLGSHDRGTLLSSLIDRLHPASVPAWPALEGTVKAASLVLGPVTLHEATAELDIHPTGAQIVSLNAGLLGGRVQGAGTVSWAGGRDDKPDYTLTAHCGDLAPAGVGAVLGQRWSGGVFNADGKIELTGYTSRDLASSATGVLHFDWAHGSMAAQPAAPSRSAGPPLALNRFQHWTGDADIANGVITLGKNQLLVSGRKRTLEATLSFGDPPKIVFAVPKAVAAAKQQPDARTPMPEMR